MKRIFIIALILLFFPLVSRAITVTTSKIGETTHYNFSNGTSGKSFQIGGTTHYSFSDGTSGKSFQIGGTTHYSFSNPISKETYDLGNGSNIPVYTYTPGEYYSTNGPMLIDNACKGLSSSTYPDWAKRGTELTNGCMGSMCPESGCDMTQYQNGLSKCLREGPERALKEILEICTKKQAEIYLERVKLIESSSKNDRIITINIYSNSDKKSLLTKYTKNVYSPNGYEVSLNNIYIDWSQNDLSDIEGFYFSLNKAQTLSNDLSNFEYTKNSGSSFLNIEKGNYNLYFRLKYKDGYISPVKYIFSMSVKEAKNSLEANQSNGDSGLKIVQSPSIDINKEDLDDSQNEVLNLDNDIQIKEENSQMKEQQEQSTNIEKQNNTPKISWFKKLTNFIVNFFKKR